MKYTVRKDVEYDLCFSLGLLDRIPEQLLPNVFKEMERTCKRGLHGVETERFDGGFDQALCTVKSKAWWKERLPSGHEVYDRHELEGGELPPEYLAGDGKLKVQVGSFVTMFHHGWINLDVHNLVDFALAHRYHYKVADARAGLPFDTGSVDLLYSCHFLEHLTFADGQAFLKECRRVLKPKIGAMRIIVPDAALLMRCYNFEEGLTTKCNVDEAWRMANFDEINDNCKNATTPAAKLHALLYDGHSATYDMETLSAALQGAGFLPKPARFRAVGEAGHPGLMQLQRECLDMLPCLSLYCDALHRSFLTQTPLDRLGRSQTPQVGGKLSGPLRMRPGAS